MPTAWRTYQIPLNKGLDTRWDSRALQPPGMSVCKNAEFIEFGGAQKRLPYASVGNGILGGGTLSDVRKIVSHGGELLCFTSDALYSWSSRDAAWVRRADYVAPKVSEGSKFVNSTEQTQWDRCEVGGVAFFAWVENNGSNYGVYIAATDVATGAVTLAPRLIETDTDMPRLVVCGGRALLFYHGGSVNHRLRVVSIDPASIPSSLDGGSTIVNSTTARRYDVVVDGTTALVAVSSNSLYRIYGVSSLGAVNGSVEKSLTADGPIAISVAPDRKVQIVRGSGTSVLGDRLAAVTLADEAIGQPVGSISSGTINQIACAHRDVAESGGAYRCYAFWSANETDQDNSSFQTKYNYVATDGSVGSQSNFVLRTGIASRAFAHGGRVYVWVVFAGSSEISGMGTSGFKSAPQNTYFLYRDDALLIAKGAVGVASGFAESQGILPGVQSVGGNRFVFCAGERRLIQISSNRQGYGARTPREITVEFDSNEARRTTKIGETIYLSGGQILQYDGEWLSEVGFHVFPWYFVGLDGGAGSKPSGSYTYKGTYKWENAKGEIDRSSTASTCTVTLGSPNRLVAFAIAPLHVTMKQGVRRQAAVEVWGTVVNPTVSSPFYLTNAKDPKALTNPNRYIGNIATDYYTPSYHDSLTDANLTGRESHVENGSVLENLAPPPATILISNQDRVFLAGVAGDPDRVWYSKLREPQSVVSFHDALTIDIPYAGGDITALAFLDDTLVVFRESAIYAVPGDGFDNTGGGFNYGPARRLPSDVGAVSAEAVGLLPDGILFKSSKGWHKLNRGFSVEYVGAPVHEFDDQEVKAVHVMESKHQVRCLTDGACLVWDYVAGAWSEWTITDGVSATMWGGAYHYASDDDVLAEQSDYSAANYHLDVELGALQLGGMAGYQLVRWMHIVGEQRSNCRVRIRIAYDHSNSDASGPTWTDDVYFDQTATAGATLQCRFGPSRCRSEAFRIRITDYALGSTSNPPAGEGLRLTGLGLEVGLERGTFRGLPAAQKV